MYLSVLGKEIFVRLWLVDYAHYVDLQEASEVKRL